MNATLISKEKTAVKLSFEVSAEVLEQGMAFAYNKHKNNLSLPGFRKGKVPRKLIEAQYGEGFFYEDAINHIFPDEYMAAVKELDLDVVSAPTLDIDYIQSGKGAKFICDVTVKPEVELGQYKGLEVEKVSAEVTDEDVMKELEKVQKQRDAISAITTYNGLNNISDLKCYLSYLQQLEKVFPVTGPKVPAFSSFDS